MQKIAKTAMKILKGAIADLPATVKLVKICSKLYHNLDQYNTVHLDVGAAKLEQLSL